MRDRMETIVDNFHGPYEPQPLCELLQADLDIQPSDEFDAHEYAHAFINSIAQVALIRGAKDPADTAFLAFTIGRKWGLIEATESLDTLDAAE